MHGYEIHIDMKPSGMSMDGKVFSTHAIIAPESASVNMLSATLDKMFDQMKASIMKEFMEKVSNQWKTQP
jgi:hypothetical protein